jgi:hypothetical protein
MNCVVCGVEVIDGAKFCPACGARILTEADLRGPNDITSQWVAEGFTKLGYTIESEAENKFFARHANRTNYLVELKPALPAVLLTAYWGLNPRSKAMRTVAERVAAANAASYYVTFCVSDATLVTSSVLHICTKVSHTDIEKFLGVVDATLTSALNSSGLAEAST